MRPKDQTLGNDGWNGRGYGRYSDPATGNWGRMTADFQMRSMIAIGRELVSRGDRGVLVDFYDDFLGDGEPAAFESEAQEPWLFWPGGWHAGRGWWDDGGVNYSLEAISLKEDAEAEVAMVAEKDDALDKVRAVAEEAVERYNALVADTDAWEALDDEEREDAHAKMVQAQQATVPKRLHRVTAALIHDMGEAARQRLKPLGRKGASELSAWHGVKVGSVSQETRPAPCCDNLHFRLLRSRASRCRPSHCRTTTFAGRSRTPLSSSSS